MQRLEAKNIDLEEQATNQEQERSSSVQSESSAVEMAAEIAAKDQLIASQEAELAALRKQAENAAAHAQQIEKLQRTINSQKQMLRIKQQEINVLAAAQDSDVFATVDITDTSLE